MFPMIRTLSRLEGKSFLGLNVLKYERDPKAKRKQRAMTALLIFLAVYFSAMLAVQTWALMTLGLAEQLPAVLLLAAAELGYLVTLWSHTLFSERGYEQLSALPIPAKVIALSRMERLCRIQLLLTVFLTPAVLVYGIQTGRDWTFYLKMLPALLVTALSAMSLALLLQALICRLSGSPSHRTAIHTFLLTLATLLSVVLPMLITGLPDMNDLSGSLQRSLQRGFPVFDLMGRAVVSHAGGEYFLILVGMLLLFLISAAVITQCFSSVCRSFFSGSDRKSRRKDRLERSSLTGALVKKERKAYFSCPIYVSNTIIGPVLAVILSALPLLLPMDALTEKLPVPVSWLAAPALSAVVCMMCPAACALSMEGDRIWILRSLPIPAGEVLKGKLLWSLTLLLPASVLSQVLLLLGLKPGSWAVVWLLLCPPIYVTFSCVFALSVNLRFPNYRWKKPEEVVKQGLSCLIGGMVPSLLFLGAAGLMAVTKTILVLPALALLCVLASLVLISRWSRARL